MTSKTEGPISGRPATTRAAPASGSQRDRAVAGQDSATSPLVDDSRLIEGILRGDASSLSVVDGWIDVVLHADARSIPGEWDDLRQEIRTRVFRNLSRGSFAGRSTLQSS